MEDIMSSHFSLSDKVAIVTGGGKGIGKAIAVALGDAGANVVVCSRTREDLEKVTQEIQQKGRKALAIKTDITSKEELNNLVQKTMEEFKRIDILVNNAGLSYMRPLSDFKEEGWDKIFNTNVKAVFLLSREVAKIMKEQGGGRIINITTGGAERAGINMGPYHTSKAALKMLSMCMAVEWAPFKINVNCVGPGLTRTEFSKPLWSNPDIYKMVAGNIPLGRIGEPEEIAGAVIFLASDAANFITGHSIYIDGGALTR
jgi:NAD(P)-dependent dehydrogenase (short-subunit alcohol dehydrogenase family)